MRRIVSLIFVLALLLTACGDTSSTGKNTYEQITQEAAKEMMDTAKAKGVNFLIPIDNAVGR